MGLATQIETAIDTLLNAVVISKAGALASALTPIALTGVSIYILVMGFAIIRGESHDPFHTFLWKAFKIAMITGVALNATDYGVIVKDFIDGTLGAFMATFGNATTIGGLIDDVAAPYEALGNTLWQRAVVDPWGLPNVTLLAAAGLTAVAQAIMMIIGLGMYLLAKVGLGLVIATGPVFIFLATFPATQKYTESWISQAMTLVMTMALIGLSIAMLTDFAKQFAQHINAVQSDSQTLIDCLALFITTIVLCVVLLSIKSLAQGMMGGLNIDGIGSMIGRAFMNMMKDRVPGMPDTKSNEIKPGSSKPAQPAQSGQPQHSVPMYRRHAGSR